MILSHCRLKRQLVSTSDSNCLLTLYADNTIQKPAVSPDQDILLVAYSAFFLSFSPQVVHSISQLLGPELVSRTPGSLSFYSQPEPTSAGESMPPGQLSATGWRVSE